MILNSEYAYEVKKSMTVKNIYIEQDRVEEYFDYVSRTTKTSLSASQQDSTMYLAAENRYFSGNYDNSIAGFTNYIQRFPHGLFILKAHYYLADALTRTGHPDKALPHYEWVAERGNNPYTENCLAQAAATNYAQKNYTRALDYYVPMVTVAQSDVARLEARMGIVRCWYALRDTGNVAASGNELLVEPKVTPQQRDEVYAMMARCWYYAGATAKAFDAYGQLMGSANGDYMGEAAYRRASIRFAEGDLAAAEEIIESVVENPGSDYWLAKTFILWADVFHMKGNDMQARQTLQSIIDNYEVVSDLDEEVVMEATQHLRGLDVETSDHDDASDSASPTILIEE